MRAAQPAWAAKAARAAGKESPAWAVAAAGGAGPAGIPYVEASYALMAEILINAMDEC